MVRCVMSSARACPPLPRSSRTRAFFLLCSGLRFVNEIPPGVFQPKMEIDSKGDGRTIIQDTKKGQLRFYKHPVATRWNYGALPQTYEDPHAVWPGTELKGDGDPLDAVEIGAGALEVLRA